MGETSLIVQKLSTYPIALRKRLEMLRSLIISIASENEQIGKIEESLKWGQISFATVRPKTGTPIRIDGNVEAGTYSIFVPCSTSLIEGFRTVHPDMFAYRGNREIKLGLPQALPKPELTLFLTAALTYHLD